MESRGSSLPSWIVFGPPLGGSLTLWPLKIGKVGEEEEQVGMRKANNVIVRRTAVEKY